MTRSVLVDTGPLVAVADRDDAHHGECVEFFDGLGGKVIVPAPVVVEVCWLLAVRVGPHAEAAFLAGLIGDGIRVEELHDDDYQRAAQLVDRYADLDLGFVDASVISLAEDSGWTRSSRSTVAISTSCAPVTSKRSPCCPDPWLSSK